MVNNWEFQNKVFDESMIGNNYGFIYLLKIKDLQGNISWYYGKKAFTHKKKTKLSKKARVGTRKRVSITKKSSGWENYQGSCKPLLEAFKTKKVRLVNKEIIKLCPDRSSLAYWETHYLCVNEVLFSDLYWNSNVSSRYFKGKISK